MINKVIAHIEANKEEYVRRMVEFLRIPCISRDESCKNDMQTAAQWVNACFEKMNIQSEIVQTEGHPMVIADTGPVEGGGPTILIYGHYDVQPTGDESLWNSPPFEPTMRDGAVFARGSADDKGQLLTHVFAVESWLKTAGKLPLRVKFIIEGEEEIGSANMFKVVPEHADRLACDYVVISDTAKFSASEPAITCGTKGIVFKEITVYGPKQDLHSGSFGGTVVNPGNALAQIIAGLKDADNRVAIPGFYDNVRELTPEEKTAIAELPFVDNDYRDSMEVPALDGERGFSTLERRWARPTLDVNGITVGQTGAGGSTIVPAKAVALLSMRIVPDQDPATIAKLFDEAAMALVPKGVRVEIKTPAMAPAYLSPLDSPGMQAATEAIKAGFGTKPFYIREGGTLPILPLFSETLKAESLLMGWCTPDCNAHSPNEFLNIDDFFRGTLSSAHFLDCLPGKYKG